MTNNSSNSGRNLQLCDHCGKKLGKLCNLIVPSNVDIELFGAKIETICIKCAVKFVTGFKREGKPVRIRRIPATSDMFKRYSKWGVPIYHATGKYLDAVGTLPFIIGVLNENYLKEV